MIKFVLDGTPVEAAEGVTVFKAAQQAGIAIPHFCYHPAFVPEGSCRLCVVEIEGSPKLELSCSTVVREGMKVQTQSPAVRDARRGALEFLLAEHPLDCPICDKAGECKLQDYYQDYGLTESVFREFKEKREKKVRIGEQLILDRERCVLCTRCVRFLSEITKTHELGLFERGIHAEIGIYEDQPVRNGYSGNLVDLCPVGAITDAEFRFKTRPWFLTKGESICPLCSRGCNIFIDYHPGFPRVPASAKVYRTRPRLNEAVNRHWICDHGRYGFVRLQNSGRCDKLVWNKGNSAAEWSWDKAVMAIAERIRALREKGKADRISLLLTAWLTNEELFLIKKIFKDALGVTSIHFSDPAAGSDDGFLLKADRSPNRRGAQEMGFEVRPPDLDVLSRDTDILFIFGSRLAETVPAEAWKSALNNIPVKILVTPHLNALADAADFVLPAAFISEKSGTLTNVEGRVQKIAAIARACGDIRPESEILLDLAKDLHIDDGFFGGLNGSGAVYRALGKEIPFFGERP